MASSASMLINYPTTFCGVRNSSNPNNDQFSDQINIPSSLNNNINISKITSKTNKIIPKAVASPVIPSINSNNITTTTTPNIKRIIHEFDPKVPAEDGFTPPSTWYTDPSLYSHELDRIFYKGWQVAGIFFYFYFHLLLCFLINSGKYYKLIIAFFLFGAH